MNDKFLVTTDKKEKVKLESSIIAAEWLCAAAHGGQEAKLRVKTVFVADDSPIEIKGRSSEGKAPGTLQGKVLNNEFMGALLIPDKVTPNADIWFEAKLPKHGVKLESDPVPGKPPILVSKICWDKSEIRRGEEVKLTCRFESGVFTGQDAVFGIYEHNPNSYDSKVANLRVTIENNKAEAVWQFDFDEKTSCIATAKELKPINKSYVNPQYFFVCGVDGMSIGNKRESGLLKFLDWAEIGIFDAEDNPCPDVKGSLTLADGSDKDFTTDDKGMFRLDDVAPGEIYVTLKELNKIDAINYSSGESKNNVPLPDDTTATAETGDLIAIRLCQYHFSH